MDKLTYHYLTSRGNDSIKKSLQIAKKLGYNDVYIADQGGWITFRQYPMKLGMKLHEIPSDFERSFQSLISQITFPEITDVAPHTLLSGMLSR